MMAVDKKVREATWPSGQAPDIRLNGQPTDESKASILWDGEWEITWVTFRDMALAGKIPGVKKASW